MATITFNPLVAVDFTALDLARSTVEATTPASYDFDTASAIDVDVEGSGFTYDASSNLTGGSISRIDIDLAGDQPSANGGDINISGLSITLTPDLGGIDNGAFSLFGVALQGNDTFLMAGLAEDADTIAATNRIFGDDLSNLVLIFVGGSNSNTGGNDIFAGADNRLEVSGDVWTATNSTNFLSTYNGGNDIYTTSATEEFHRIAGDAWILDRTGMGSMTLNGGDDRLDLGGSTSGSSWVSGDVNLMNNGVLNGGDDFLVGDDSVSPEIAGDVRDYNGGTVNGGDDVISANNSGRIGGDVFFLNSPVPTGVFTINGGADEIHGGSGDDFIGGDVYDRNSTVDNLIVGDDDTIFGGDGHDSIMGEVLFGDASIGVTGGADVLYGNAGHDVLRGQGGDDFLDGGSGNDTIDGGVGVDTISYAHARDGVMVNLLIAGAQNTIGAGVDSLLGGEHLEGSRYDDVLRGNNVANELDGGRGNDSLYSGAGSDNLNGGAGDDTLNSIGQTADVLNGGLGDDLLESDGGANLLIGGFGVDTVSFATAAANSVIDLAAGQASQVGAATVDILFQVENAVGGAADDQITGTADVNLLSGGGGKDTIEGAGGNDTLDGGDGVDDLKGGDGDDLLLGVLGDDKANGGLGADTLNGGDGRDRLTGDSGDDLLDGDIGNDVLNGGRNNDTLNGGDGGDTLNGDQNLDVLNGGAGADKLNGGDDQDTLSGGEGVDTHTGGSGADTFVFSATAGNVTDVIADFEDTGAISDDLIDVTAYGFASVAAITATADGDDVLLDFGDGDRVRLVDYLLTHTLAEIDAGDFLL